MPSTTTAVLSVALAFFASNVVAQPIVGVDLTEHANLVRQACARDSSCRTDSILAVTNRTGNAATCVTSTLENTTLLFSNPRFYLLYGYRSTCSFPSTVHAKINNKWYEDVGTIRPGTNATLSLLYEASTGRGPSVVMFCRPPGTPRDDLTCTGDASASGQKVSPPNEVVGSNESHVDLERRAAIEHQQGNFTYAEALYRSLLNRTDLSSAARTRVWQRLDAARKGEQFPP
jgi:hypothetical protein